MESSQHASSSSRASTTPCNVSDVPLSLSDHLSRPSNDNFAKPPQCRADSNTFHVFPPPKDVERKAPSAHVEQQEHTKQTLKLAMNLKRVTDNGTRNSDDVRDEKREDDGMECCTQQLEDVDETRRNDVNDDEEETQMYPSFDTGTLSYGAECCFQEERDEEKTRDIEERNGDGNSRRNDSVLVLTRDGRKEQRNGEDEVTSREGSQATEEEYLTPRVAPSRIERSDPIETSCNHVVGAADRVEHMAKTSQDEDDQDECEATQRQIQDESVNFPLQQCTKPSHELLARKHATESQSKALRSLEFSFAMRESQEDELHLSASVSSDDKLAAKVFPQSHTFRPFESSVSPVCPPTLTSISADDSSSSCEVAGCNQANSKRQLASSLQSNLVSSPKRLKTTSRVVDSPSKTTAMSMATKHKHDGFLSDVPALWKESKEGDPVTPQPSMRCRPRSTPSPPRSSTPTVRTRTRTLTPVPPARAYASRSRTLFKYKLEFCLTGFVKTGEENLKELIEGHGGRIPERYQDVLFKGNPKAVVIATPVSWRKRKFMQAIACGIPVVHTDWLKDCIEAGYVVPFNGYQVPRGYSVVTRKFECLPPRELYIFEGYSFGIANDVAQMSKAEAKDKASLMAFILKTCGATAVHENLSIKDRVHVDVVLCDEYTPTCRYYKRKRHIPVKDFQWVTECMILQQFVDPEDAIFEPLRVGDEDVVAANAEIGDSDNTTLKLYTGELVMVDIAGTAADHYLLFNVCEILSIHRSSRKDETSQSRQKDGNESRVMLRVGILKRTPCNPELSKTPIKVLDISSSQVKRRVVAISKENYRQLKFKDESIFYLEDESSECAMSEHKWLTQ